MSAILKAIRAKCLDCTCQQREEVKECNITDCPLFPYRMGKNPFHTRKGPGNPEALKKYRANLTKNQE